MRIEGFSEWTSGNSTFALKLSEGTFDRLSSIAAFCYSRILKHVAKMFTSKTSFVSISIVIPKWAVLRGRDPHCKEPESLCHRPRCFLPFSCSKPQKRPTSPCMWFHVPQYGAYNNVLVVITLVMGGLYN